MAIKEGKSIVAIQDFVLFCFLGEKMTKYSGSHSTLNHDVVCLVLAYHVE